MKAPALLIWTSVGLLFLLGGSQLRADITVRLSVKFILKPDGTRPAAGVIGTAAGFDAEITRGNQILAATGRGYQLLVVEYLDIRPPVPGGQPSDYWFNLDARSNRRFIENAALADQPTWRWNANAINLYINNSGSGQCSFVGDGGAITLGNDIGTGTVLHEVGHFFDLRHTHTGDPACGSTPPPYVPADGDGLAATVPDHNCLTTRAALLAALPSELQAAVDTAWLNVMSYHQEDQLLDDQMDIWTFNANWLRNGFCSGRTWVVDRNSGCLYHDGNSLCLLFGGPFTVVRDGVNSAQSGDIVLIRAGNYNEPMTISRPLTLRASRGNVSIGIP
jgi:hypothetical protein